MNDEIKEILDRLDYEEWEVELYKVPITWCELYTIRDYITELNKTIDKIVLKCFNSCMTLRQFKNIYKLAYNKEYKEPKDLEDLKEDDK